MRRDRAAGVSLRNKKALPEGRAVDKMKDLGYSMDTGVLPVGRLPHALRRDNRYFGGQRLSLLVICLENQGNDSSNEHAELENSFPCNIHTCHPLSFTIGGKEASPPKKIEGNRLPGYYRQHRKRHITRFDRLQGKLRSELCESIPHSKTPRRRSICAAGGNFYCFFTKSASVTLSR